MSIIGIIVFSVLGLGLAFCLYELIRNAILLSGNNLIHEINNEERYW